MTSEVKEKVSFKTLPFEFIIFDCIFHCLQGVDHAEGGRVKEVHISLDNACNNGGLFPQRAGL